MAVVLTYLKNVEESLKESCESSKFHLQKQNAIILRPTSQIQLMYFNSQIAINDIVISENQ